jgi:hypothetical protein
VLRAWTDKGLTHCVGDNTRPPLRNQQNYMWPYTTTAAADGFKGFTVVPRCEFDAEDNGSKANKAQGLRASTTTVTLQVAQHKNGLILVQARAASKIY